MPARLPITAVPVPTARRLRRDMRLRPANPGLERTAHSRAVRAVMTLGPSGGECMRGLPQTLPDRGKTAFAFEESSESEANDRRCAASRPASRASPGTDGRSESTISNQWQCERYIEASASSSATQRRGQRAQGVRPLSSTAAETGAAPSPPCVSGCEWLPNPHSSQPRSHYRLDFRHPAARAAQSHQCSR